MRQRDWESSYGVQPIRQRDKEIENRQMERSQWDRDRHVKVSTGRLPWVSFLLAILRCMRRVRRELASSRSVLTLPENQPKLWRHRHVSLAASFLFLLHIKTLFSNKDGYFGYLVMRGLALLIIFFSPIYAYSTTLLYIPELEERHSPSPKSPLYGRPALLYATNLCL